MSAINTGDRVAIFHDAIDKRSLEGIAVVEEVMRNLGLEPARAVCNGGLDANWMTARGIPTVTLGCGQENPHTVEERLNLAEFHRACRIALGLTIPALLASKQ